MNRAARRARERAQSRSALTSNHFAKGEVADESFPPEPGPIGTELGRYKFGGKNWVLMTFHQPNNTTRVVMSPRDANLLAQDIIKTATMVDVTSIETPAAEPAPSSSGLVIAHDLPKEPG